MRRARLIYTGRARHDLTRIADYLEEHAGKRTAGKWTRELERRALGLEYEPELGTVDDQLGGLRRLVVRPYLIIYRLSAPTEVQIVRIVDGRRDLTSLFDSQEPEQGPERD